MMSILLAYERLEIDNSQKRCKVTLFLSKERNNFDAIIVLKDNNYFIF